VRRQEQNQRDYITKECWKEKYITQKFGGEKREERNEIKKKMSESDVSYYQRGNMDFLFAHEQHIKGSVTRIFKMFFFAFFGINRYKSWCVCGFKKGFLCVFFCLKKNQISS